LGSPLEIVAALSDDVADMPGLPVFHTHIVAQAHKARRGARLNKLSWRYPLNSISKLVDEVFQFIEPP
jgi:hypothetical protein